MSAVQIVMLVLAGIIAGAAGMSLWFMWIFKDVFR